MPICDQIFGGFSKIVRGRFSAISPWVGIQRASRRSIRRPPSLWIQALWVEMSEGAPPNQRAARALVAPQGSSDGMPVDHNGDLDARDGRYAAQEGKPAGTQQMDWQAQSSVPFVPSTPNQSPGQRYAHPPAHMGIPEQQIGYSPYQEIEELRHKNRTLEKEKFEKELESRRQIRELVRQEEIRIAELTSDYEARLKRRMEEFEQREEEHMGVINHLRQELRQKDRVTSQCEQEIRKKDAKLAAYKKNISDMKMQVTETQEQVVALRKRQQSLNDGHTNAAHTAALEEEIGALRTRIRDSLSEQFDKEMEVQRRMRDMMRQEGARIAELNSDHDAELKMKVQEFHQREKELKNEISRLKHELGAKDMELTSNVNQLRQELRNRDVELAAYKKTPEETERKVLEAQKQLEEFRQREKELGEQVSRVKQEREAKDRNFTRIVNHLRQELMNRDAQLAIYKKTPEDMQRKMLEGQKELAEFRKREKELRDRACLLKKPKC
eukprot:evm.model.scf_921.5 EVM.evm.TU.scf_921.5   scf_921:55853-58518(-)